MRIQALTEVIALAEKLNPEEKLQLIEHMACELQHTPKPAPHLSWKEASGLGKEIWAEIDVDRYIDTLREEWEH
jgi:hypothetical protein